MTQTTPTSLRLVKRSLADQAYDELKRQILDQRLLPGARLNIDALSRECGVSSSPMREALVRLGSEGLVLFEANTGFSVSPVPDAEQIGHLLDYRTVLEAYGARVGAGHQHVESLRAMQHATEAMAVMRAQGVGYKEYRTYFEHEQVFHQALVDSAANPVISAAYRELHLILAVARMSVIPESDNVGSDEAVEEHRAIIAAFEQGDGAAAEAALLRHLQSARVRMKSGAGEAATHAAAFDTDRR